MIMMLLEAFGLGAFVQEGIPHMPQKGAFQHVLQGSWIDMITQTLSFVPSKEINP